MIRWPWTSLQTLNLDWILARMKELIEKVNAFSENVTASATTVSPSTPASVTVTGDLDTGLNFEFNIPKGETGPAGADGQDGRDGRDGADGVGSITKVVLSPQETGNVNINAQSAYTLHYIFSGGLTPTNMVSIQQYEIRTSPNVYADGVIIESVMIDPDNWDIEVRVFNTTASTVTISADLCTLILMKFN